MPHSSQSTKESIPWPYLAHAIVCELDVSLVVQENIVQLQVAVDDSFFMQEVQSNTDFSSIKSEGKKKRNLEIGVSDLSAQKIHLQKKKRNIKIGE